MQKERKCPKIVVEFCHYLTVTNKKLFLLLIPVEKRYDKFVKNAGQAILRISSLSSSVDLRKLKREMIRK